MKKVIRLTESDLMRIVKRVINEETTDDGISGKVYITKNDNIITLTKNQSGLTGTSFRVPEGTKFELKKGYVSGNSPYFWTGTAYKTTGSDKTKVEVTLWVCKNEFSVTYGDRYRAHGTADNLKVALNNAYGKCSN